MGTRLHSSEPVPASSLLPTWYEDDYFDGADLAASMFDLSRRLSFPRAAAPVAGDTIRDVLDASFEAPAAPLPTGSIVLQVGQALGFDGQRLDFSTLAFPSNVLAPNVVRLPSRVMSQIWGGGAVPQYYLIWTFMTLPTDADWNPSSGHVTFMATGESDNGEAVPALARMSMVNSPTTAGPGISTRRQRSLSSAHQINLAIPAASRGQKALVATYRTAAGVTLYCRTAAGGIVSSTSNQGNPDGADNSVDFSAVTVDYGLCQPGTPKMGGTDAIPNAKKFKIGKGGIEALRVSGRDPVAVLNAEWTRELARGVHL